MRYKVRMVDQDLPALAREIAMACWRAADTVAPTPPGKELYRTLYRAVRGVLKSRIQAYKFCGCTAPCNQKLAPPELGSVEWTEKFPPEQERIRIYQTDTAPGTLVAELARETVRVVAKRQPARGVSKNIKLAIQRALRGKVLKSAFCGEVLLCERNEAFNPWDRREAPKFRR